MKPEGLEQKIEELSSPIIDGMGLELVAVVWATEHGRRVLRVYIDKPGGVTLDDCADFSRELGTQLDVAGLITERYTLEISSPGLDRPLVKEADFKRFAGKRARIRTKVPIDGRKNFKAAIEGAANGVVTIVDFDSRRFDIQISDIEKARLEVEL